MKRLIVLVALIVVGAVSMALSGFQDTARGQGQGQGRGEGGRGTPPPLEVKKVKDNLWMIVGGGAGNTAVFQIANGVVLVDTKNPNYGQQILDKVRTVTDKPITTIINTHTHADHTGSNEFFGTAVEFVVQENTRANMEKMDLFKGDKSVFLPKKTYKDKLTIGKGKDEIDLYYFGRAHTNGDSFVVFKELRAMHAGDAFANKSHPLVDMPNGGSVLEYGKTLAKAASTIKNVDTVINGHTNDTTTFADLKDYADFNSDFAAWVQAEKKGGKTAEQAGEEYKLPEKWASKGFTASQGRGGRGGYRGNIASGYMELDKK